MSRAIAYIVGLGTLGAVLAPAFAEPGWDSYPLSSYPMFTQSREKPTLYFVEEVDGAQRARVPPQLVANDEVMQVAVTVLRAVERGPGALDALCQQVAARVRARGASRERARAHGTDAQHRLEIVGARFDPIRYFAEGPEPEERTVLARCSLERPP